MAPTADAKALDDLIASTQALLTQFTTSLSNSNSINNNENAPTTPPSAPIANPPNPLRVFADASTLLKAHVTKLSLLTINAPFTPSAVTKVLRDLASTCLPALISAVQICQQQERATWGALLGREAALRARRVFVEMQTLLREVQSVAAGASTGAGGNRDSLSATGVVWEACDALAELEGLGVAGLAVRKAEEWRDTIRDAIEELQEWAEGEDLESEGRDDDALLDSGDEGVGGDEEGSLDEMFNAANSLPADRPELKVLVGRAVEKLKKVEILYRALGKRRLKAFKSVEAADGRRSGVEYLDEIVANLKALPDKVDDLASTFYDLDEEAVEEALADCVDKARETAKLARLDYDGKEDEFSKWSEKWIVAVS